VWQSLLLVQPKEESKHLKVYYLKVVVFMIAGGYLGTSSRRSFTPIAGVFTPFGVSASFTLQRMSCGVEDCGISTQQAVIGAIYLQWGQVGYRH